MDNFNKKRVKGSKFLIRTKDIENLFILITEKARVLVSFIKRSDISENQEVEVDLRASFLSMLFHLIIAVILGFVFMNPFKISVFFKNLKTIFYLIIGITLFYKETISFFEWLPVFLKKLVKALRTKGFKGLFITNEANEGKIKII